MNHNNIHVIHYNNKEIILVGTAHVSNDSATLVHDAITFYKPDNICIELDKDRFEALQNPVDWNQTDLKEIIKNKKSMQLLANMMLSSYQVRMAKEMDSEVGLEMKTAIKLAEELDIPLTMADRNVNITFKRIWRSLNLKDKASLLYVAIGSIFEDDEEEALSEDKISDMLQDDMLTASLNEIREEVPKIATILVDERDQYLAYQIKNAPGERVLAVVGGAHIPGIKSEIDKNQDIHKINSIPDKKSYTKYLNYLFMGLIALILILPFRNGFNVGLQSLIKWSVWSGGMAALFTAIIGAHPLTIIATFVTAPLAAIHPLIAVGFIAAYVEVSLRKPTVKDIDNISEDIKSFKGFRSNRFIKALSLVFIANLGSVIGQLISGTSIVSNLFK